VLGLVSPLNGTQHPSSTVFDLDVSGSVDHDGDAFTVTLRSSLVNEPLLTGVDPNATHAFGLPAGDHIMTVTLEDSTGMSRDETFVLTVVESAPVLVLESPENRASIAPGGAIVLAEASYDADNDLAVREWRRWSTASVQPEVIATASQATLAGWLPGEYHLSLYVEDARGHSVEEHLNITVQSSLPRLDGNSLVLSSTTFTQNELNTLTFSIVLDDADGTTQDVRANVTLGLQQWEVNLSDADGDNLWEGSLEWRPETTGRPNFKIVARDGEGANVNVDIVSRTLVVEAPEGDARAVYFAAGVGGFVLVFALVAFLVVRRKRAMEDIDVLTSWEAFRAPSNEPQVKAMPDLPPVDGTDEVEATMGDDHLE